MNDSARRRHIMIQDLNDLRVFYTIAENGSISRAADVLHVSQPAVSQTVRNLEKDTGFPLFIRSSKGVKLTTEAQEIYSYCKTIFKQVDELNRSVEGHASLETGILTIGASDTICKYFLIDRLKSFEKLYPAIRYRVTNCTTAESLRLLKQRDVDISFVHTPIPSNSLTGISLQDCLTLEDYFVCSRDFDASGIHSLADLMKYRTLLLENTSSSRKVLDENLLKYDVRLKPKFELASLDLLIEFCKKNMGIICVAKQYIQSELEKGELKLINIPEHLDKRHISLATDDEYVSKAAQRFIEHIQAEDF